MDNNGRHLRLPTPNGGTIDLFAYESASGRYLLYVPECASVCTATETDMRHLEFLAAEGRSDDFTESLAKEIGEICGVYTPDNIPELTILLNQKCNFSCSYCYSAAGRSDKVIDDADLKAVLDYFVSGGRGEHLRLVFSGGGDPVLSFDKFKYAVEYAVEKASERNITLSTGMVTNGSTLKDDHIEFIRRHNIELVVSCDILEDVHNAQRSHYDTVAATIDKLCEAGIETGIRSTITPMNVARQCEMVEVLHSRFPRIRSAAFEAVLNRDLFPSVEELSRFYETFADNIFAARRLGDKYGITIGNTLINNVRSLKSRACLGKLVVTPYGDLAACSRISSPREKFFDDFVYGSVRGGKVEVDEAKYDALMRHNAHNERGCGECVAKLHCGGGCLLARLANSEAYMAAYCRFVRDMTRRAVFEKRDIAERRLESQNIYLYYMDAAERAVLYSPIARRYAVMTTEQLEEYLLTDEYADLLAPLGDYVPLSQQRKVRKPEDYTLLTVLPNNVCNFNCSYCYSAAGRNGSRLSTEDLKTAIDFFTESKPDGFGRTLTISFMGGGEPMLSWETVASGAEYARGKALRRGLKLNLRIITNGSVSDDEIIGFAKANDIEISVSFEIIPEIQNLQRKNFDVVRTNILRLTDSGIPVQINSTITPANVERLAEMITILHEQYPEVKNAMFEPVVAQDMFATAEDMRIFYERYVDQFCVALKLADRYGIALTSFAYLRTIYPLERACPGELCLTPDGDITGCYCVASAREPLFVATKYGRVEAGKVVFDIARFEALLSENVYTKSECDSCPVKWNCGGGCFHQYKTYSRPYRDEVCRFTRLFVERIVKYKAEKFMRMRYGDAAPEKPVIIDEII